MEWSPDVNGGFSTADKTYLPSNDDEIYGYKKVNVESQETDPDSYLWATRFLLKARKESGALTGGGMELIPMGDPAVLAYWRINGDERLLLAIGGREVMEILGIGSGPLVGRALRYLTQQVGENPGCNSEDELRVLLRAWRVIEP